jgi:ubiquinone biosynthesis accessory factor UbiJ
MWIERLQGMIDRQVEGSPRARELLSGLDGRRMQVVARLSPWRITLHAAGGRLQVLHDDSIAPDVQLAGTLLALLALLREEPAQVIRRGDVSMTGDAELGTRFQELTLLLRPEPEAELARIVGDIPAHGAGLLLRKVFAYGRSTLRTQVLNMGEYLAHERQLLVPRIEAARFLEDVDSLREEADRLAARVSVLESAGSCR